MPTIEILVSPLGETQVKTSGFVGTGCRAASESLEQALGRRTREHLTSEFYQPTLAEQSQRQVRGTSDPAGT